MGPPPVNCRQFIQASVLRERSASALFRVQCVVSLRPPGGMSHLDFARALLAKAGMRDLDDLRSLRALPRGRFICREVKHAAFHPAPGDPLLGAAILGLCNAAFYSSERPVVWTEARLRRRVESDFGRGVLWRLTQPTSDRCCTRPSTRTRCAAAPCFRSVAWSSPTAVPTLCVTLGRMSVLRVNLDFVAAHCTTEDHVKALLVHEFLHVLLGHTLRFATMSPALNIALDAVINAIIHRRLGASYSDVMASYYADVGRRAAPAAADAGRRTPGGPRAGGQA